MAKYLSTHERIGTSSSSSLGPVRGEPSPDYVIWHALIRTGATAQRLRPARALLLAVSLSALLGCVTAAFRPIRKRPFARSHVYSHFNPCTPAPPRPTGRVPFASLPRPHASPSPPLPRHAIPIPRTPKLSACLPLTRPPPNSHCHHGIHSCIIQSCAAAPRAAIMAYRPRHAATPPLAASRRHVHPTVPIYHLLLVSLSLVYQ